MGFASAGIVYGTAGYFAPQAGSVATTTPSLMTAGTATTTIVYDSYALLGTNQFPGQKQDYTDSSTLLIQFSASSTTSTLGWKYEYSQDGIDWYADNLTSGQVASSTINNYAMSNSYTWTFASSTNLCDSTVVISTNTRNCKIVSVLTPVRFVRVVFSAPAGSANEGVFARFVPKKQNP